MSLIIKKNEYKQETRFKFVRLKMLKMTLKTLTDGRSERIAV